MTKGQKRAEIIDVKALLERDEDFLRAAVEALVQAVLEAEMSQAIGAEKGERTAEPSHGAGVAFVELIRLGQTREANQWITPVTLPSHHPKGPKLT